jgi:hypothetical protein
MHIFFPEMRKQRLASRPRYCWLLLAESHLEAAALWQHVATLPVPAG